MGYYFSFLKWLLSNGVGKVYRSFDEDYKRPRDAVMNLRHRGKVLLHMQDIQETLG